MRNSFILVVALRKNLNEDQLFERHVLSLLCEHFTILKIIKNQLIIGSTSDSYRPGPGVSETFQKESVKRAYLSNALKPRLR